MNFAIALLALMISYLLGSINSAVIISRVFYHDDVRTHGSGNAGTTNIMRTYGGKAAALCFAGDILKGTVSVLITRLLFNSAGMQQYVGAAVYVAGVVVVLGHMFPIFFKFKGGKGVATGLGAVAAISPLALGTIFVIGISLALISGFVSLGSLVGASLFIPIEYLYNGGFPTEELIPAAVLVLLIIYNHRANIKRLLTGTENKFYKKK